MSGSNYVTCNLIGTIGYRAPGGGEAVVYVKQGPVGCSIPDVRCVVRGLHLLPNTAHLEKGHIINVSGWLTAALYPKDGKTEAQVVIGAALVNSGPLEKRNLPGMIMANVFAMPHWMPEDKSMIKVYVKDADAGPRADPQFVCQLDMRKWIERLRPESRAPFSTALTRERTFMAAGLVTVEAGRSRDTTVPMLKVNVDQFRLQ